MIVGVAKPISNLEMTDVTEILSVLGRQNPELAAVGLDKLYTKMEQDGELRSTDMFQLRNFVGHLIERVKTVDPDTANALKFRIHGLVTAIDGCIKFIWKLWISDPFASTKQILDAARRFPEHVEICWLVSKVSTSMNPEQAVKLSQELIAKLPKFSQRMQGFKQLFECMKNTKQLETCEFMTVVYVFKEAGKEIGAEAKWSQEIKQEAINLIPEYIRRVFFPRNGYCALYHPDRREHLRYITVDEKAADDSDWLPKAVTFSPSNTRTAISKIKARGCKMELRSVLKNNQVQFAVVSKHPGVREERVLTYSPWVSSKELNCVSNILNFDVPVGNVENYAAYQYVLQPHGWYFKIQNAAHGGLLTLDPWELFDYEPAVHVKSCKARETLADNYETYWQVEDWYD